MPDAEGRAVRLRSVSISHQCRPRGRRARLAPSSRRTRCAMTTLLPFQPANMTPAQLAAVSFLARYSGRTHGQYTDSLRRWFSWCETNELDPLIGIQRAHVELYIHELGERGLMDSSVKTMMHGVRGFFRFAHIDGVIPADPAVYARLPKISVHFLTAYVAGV